MVESGDGERMLPDKLQKSFIWGRSFLMAAAKADNHAGSFLPFVCARNGESFRRNADIAFPGQTAVSV